MKLLDKYPFVGSFKKYIKRHHTWIVPLILLIIISLSTLFYKSPVKLLVNDSFTGLLSSKSDPMQNPYLLTKLKEHKDKSKFPYRFLHDSSGTLLPIVLVSGFFRDSDAKETYFEYINNGIKVAGVTAYKSFPKKITDNNDDWFHITDDFDYTKHIKDWMCCFSNPEHYGLSPKTHHLADISESDFYDLDDTPIPEKKYDFIYSCLQDDEDSCPMEAWNAVNRNFKTALKCFPIIMKEYKLKMLIVGRSNCGLEEEYGDQVEVVKMLPYHEFQERMRQSKFLFVPNIYDASPRVISEAIIKGLPVLMNRSILCGSKYVTPETGEVFTDEYDIRFALDRLLENYNKMSPKKWWSENYGRKVSGVKMCNFLKKSFPGVIDNLTEVYY